MPVTSSSVDARALMMAGLIGYRATGAVQHVSSMLAMPAEAEGKAQQLERALGHLVEAERLIAETGDRYADAELHRIRRDLLGNADDHPAAERCYLQAIAIAKRQSAKLWELRAAISLARLWSEQGKRDATRNLLGPTYRWFTTEDAIEVLRHLDFVARFAAY